MSSNIKWKSIWKGSTLENYDCVVIVENTGECEDFGAEVQTSVFNTSSRDVKVKIYNEENFLKNYTRLYKEEEVGEATGLAYNEGWQQGVKWSSALEASAYNNGLNHELIEHLEGLNSVDDNVYEYLKSNEFIKGFEEYEAKSTVEVGSKWYLKHSNCVVVVVDKMVNKEVSYTVYENGEPICGSCESVERFLGLYSPLSVSKIGVGEQSVVLTPNDIVKPSDVFVFETYSSGGYPPMKFETTKPESVITYIKDNFSNIKSYTQIGDKAVIEFFYMNTINKGSETEGDLELTKKYPHYYKDVRHLNAVDVYQVCQLFPVKDDSGAINHARKKLLVCGGRGGGKDMKKDIKEAYDTLGRWLNMQEENKRGE